MKTSQFVVAAIGFLYSLTLGNWIVLVLFGVNALISFRRIMKELEEGGDGYGTIQTEKPDKSRKRNDICGRPDSPELVCTPV